MNFMKSANDGVEVAKGNDRLPCCASCSQDGGLFRL